MMLNEKLIESKPSTNRYELSIDDGTEKSNWQASERISLPVWAIVFLCSICAFIVGLLIGKYSFPVVIGNNVNYTNRSTAVNSSAEPGLYTTVPQQTPPTTLVATTTTTTTPTRAPTSIVSPPTTTPTAPPIITFLEMEASFFQTSYDSGGPPCPQSVSPSNLNALFQDSSVVDSIITSADYQKLVVEIGDYIKLAEKELTQAYGRSPAFSVVMTLGDKIIYNNSFGFLHPLNTTSTQTPNLDTVYQMGSNTKTMTSLAFFREIELGNMNSLDKVSDYISEFSIVNPFSTGRLSLGQLSSQTSGLSRAPPCAGANFPTCNTSELYTRIAAQALTFAPGSQATYSNLGLGLLGHAVERAIQRRGLNETYEEYMCSAVFSKLNMTRTGFFSSQAEGTAPFYPSTWPEGTTTESINTNAATPHTAAIVDGKAVLSKMDFLAMGWGNPYGGSSSTPQDMANYARYVLKAPTNAFESAGVANASSVLAWIGPGFQLQGGLSGYSAGAWERAYVNGTYVVTKGGLAFGAATQVTLVPEIGLSVSGFWAQSFSGVPDPLVTKLTNAMTRIVRPKLLERCADPLPTMDPYIGNWGSTALQFRIGVPLNSNACSTLGSFPGGGLFATNDSLVITSLSTPRTANPSAIKYFPFNTGNISIAWTFRYSGNLKDPTTQPEGSSACYMESASGSNSLAYFVNNGSTLLGLWLPETIGSYILTPGGIL